MKTLPLLAAALLLGAPSEPQQGVSLKGTVQIKGPIPRPKKIRMNDAERHCSAKVKGEIDAEDIVANPKGFVKWAFVYVKSGLEGRRFEMPKEPAVLDQRGFEFVPRVFGMRAGQELRVTCADYTIHVVRCIPFNNPEFNVTMLQDDVITRVFPNPEVMVAFDCTHHAHMKAYAGVLDHPFFAVTDRGGNFEIRGLPAGTYTLAAWCEDRGAKEAKVTVGGETAAVRFTFE